MAYIITYSLGTITVNDTTVNTQTSLSLPGRNYAGYGQGIDQNMVSLLENFAGATAPTNPIPGQQWYDNANQQLKINTSTTATPSWSPLVLANSTANTTLSNVSITGTLLTTNITTGGAAIPGSLTGNWTLTAGSRFNATYADLAERFEADAVYEPGTVVELGGAAEVTAVVDEASDRVFGVVSDTAGYLMNATAGDDTTHPAIAMTGRVLVKVLGTVAKGDRLVSAGAGYARAAKSDEATAFNCVGRALENKTTEGAGRVLAAVSAKL